MPIDMCVEIIWWFHLEMHIKNCFVPGIFAIINFYILLTLIGKDGQNIIEMKNIQIKSCIKNGINTIK